MDYKETSLQLKINESPKVFTSFSARRCALANAYYLDTQVRIRTTLLK